LQQSKQHSWIYNSALAHILMACHQHQITASYIHLRNKHNCQNTTALLLLSWLPLPYALVANLWKL
jgi:hypothetical protein